MSVRVTQEVWIYADPDSSAESGFTLKMIDSERWWYTSGDAIKLEKTEAVAYLKSGLSKDKLLLKFIETLKDRQVHERAHAEKRVRELQEKINQLLRLTHQPLED